MLDIDCSRLGSCAFRLGRVRREADNEQWTLDARECALYELQPHLDGDQFELDKMSLISTSITSV